MCTFALKDTEVMYSVKNTFIHDIDDDGGHDEWETKSCPGRLEESDHMQELDDWEGNDFSHHCTTVTKPSCNTVGQCCTIIAEQTVSRVSKDLSLWPLRWLCNRELGYCAWIAPEPLDIPVV